MLHGIESPYEGCNVGVVLVVVGASQERNELPGGSKMVRIVVLMSVVVVALVVLKGLVEGDVSPGASVGTAAAPPGRGALAPTSRATSQPTVPPQQTDHLVDSQSPKSMDASPAAPVLMALQSPYEDVDARVVAIVGALVRSGKAPTNFALGGSAMIERLRKNGMVADWGCYQAGCFARLSKASDDVLEVVQGAREATIPGYVFALTPDPAPNKLMVLLNFKQE